MHAHKIKVVIPKDHQLTVTLPEDFPSGPAEVIVLADTSTAQRVVKLAGVLAPEVPPSEDGDPIADALREFRQERQERFEAATDAEEAG
jgi:hypothetical protein